MEYAKHVLSRFKAQFLGIAPGKTPILRQCPDMRDILSHQVSRFWLLLVVRDRVVRKMQKKCEGVQPSHSD
jgi:hypothetical protein